MPPDPPPSTGGVKRQQSTSNRSVKGARRRMKVKNKSAWQMIRAVVKRASYNNKGEEESDGSNSDGNGNEGK